MNLHFKNYRSFVYVTTVKTIYVKGFAMNTVLFGMTLYQILWYFVIYSFIGWCVEVVFHAMKAHRLVNRGFLNGPVCPVYGFGVVLVFAAVHLIIDGGGGTLQDISIIMLYPIGVFLTTAVELLGGYMLDKTFHARWWNYSSEKYNFRGYICLKFSLIWGLGVVFLVKFAHPFIDRATVQFLPAAVGTWILLALIIAYFADFVVSVLIMLKLNRSLEELDQIQKDMRIVSDQITRLVAGGSIAAEVLVDAGLTKAGLVKEDTMYAVLDQAFAAGDVIDNKEYNRFRAAGIPEPASVQVEADIKEAIAERRDDAITAINEKKEAAVSAYNERMDEARAAINETKEAAFSAYAEHRDDAAYAIAETKIAAQDNIEQTREALENKLAELKNRSAEIYKAAFRHRVFGPLRILRAFPLLYHEMYSDALQSLRQRAAEFLNPDNTEKGDDECNSSLRR